MPSGRRLDFSNQKDNMAQEAQKPVVSRGTKFTHFNKGPDGKLIDVTSDEVTRIRKDGVEINGEEVVPFAVIETLVQECANG